MHRSMAVRAYLTRRKDRACTVDAYLALQAIALLFCSPHIRDRHNHYYPFILFFYINLSLTALGGRSTIFFFPILRRRA